MATKKKAPPKKAKKMRTPAKKTSTKSPKKDPARAKGDGSKRIRALTKLGKKVLVLIPARLLKRGEAFEARRKEEKPFAQGRLMDVWTEGKVVWARVDFGKRGAHKVRHAQLVEV